MMFSASTSDRHKSYLKGLHCLGNHLDSPEQSWERSVLMPGTGASVSLWFLWGASSHPSGITSFKIYVLMSVETPRSYMQIPGRQRHDTSEKVTSSKHADKTWIGLKCLEFLKCPLLSKSELKIESEFYKASCIHKYVSLIN